ncbi:hypothetical protein TNCV_1293731 [Trichonephila clavipes]|nr:hypothetical protein TNCV_1293731 [Trichonephila clavipes]
MANDFIKPSFPVQGNESFVRRNDYDEAAVVEHCKKNPEGPRFTKWSPVSPNWGPTWSPKMMLTWLYRQDLAKLEPNLVTRNDANLALSPRSPQIPTESPL